MTAILLAVGGVAILNTASVACKMRRARVGPGAFPPSQRLDVMAMATRKPATYHCPATRWSLDDLVAALLQRHAWTMSRSSIWRLLEEADLKPHRSVYWLNSHDPDFEAKAHDICSLYLNALRFLEQGRLVICSDEKTGMQILERKYPTQPMAPGKPEKREHEYIRHGTRALIASFVVPTGQVVWNLGQTRTSADFAAHWVNVVKQLPAMHRYDWWITSTPTGASMSAVWLPSGARCPLLSTTSAEVCSGGHSCVIRAISMCSTLRPNMAPGSIKLSCGLASWPAGFLSVATSVQPKTLQRV